MEARGQVVVFFARVLMGAKTEVNQQQTARFYRKCRGGFQHWPLGWELVIPCPCPSPIRGCVFLNSKYIYLAITGTNLSVAAASRDFTFHCQTASVSWRNFFPPLVFLWLPTCESQWFQLEVCGLALGTDGSAKRHDITLRNVLLLFLFKKENDLNMSWFVILVPPSLTKARGSKRKQQQTENS